MFYTNSLINTFCEIASLCFKMQSMYKYVIWSLRYNMCEFARKMLLKIVWTFIKIVSIPGDE